MKMSEFIKIQDELIIMRRKFAYGSDNFNKCTEALDKLEAVMSKELSSGNPSKNNAEMEVSILLNEIAQLSSVLFARDS